jgi:hypothetical protein
MIFVVIEQVSVRDAGSVLEKRRGRWQREWLICLWTFCNRKVAS